MPFHSAQKPKAKDRPAKIISLRARARKRESERERESPCRAILLACYPSILEDTHSYAFAQFLGVGVRLKCPGFGFGGVSENGRVVVWRLLKLQLQSQGKIMPDASAGAGAGEQRAEQAWCAG